MVAVWAPVAGCTVTILKFAEGAPAGTITDTGTCANKELLLSCTLMPSTGATSVSVTVPVTFVPPTTVVGLRLSEASDAAPGGFTVSVAEPVSPA